MCFFLRQVVVYFSGMLCYTADSTSFFSCLDMIMTYVLWSPPFLTSPFCCHVYFHSLLMHAIQPLLVTWYFIPAPARPSYASPSTTFISCIVPFLIPDCILLTPSPLPIISTVPFVHSVCRTPVSASISSDPIAISYNILFTHAASTSCYKPTSH